VEPAEIGLAGRARACRRGPAPRQAGVRRHSCLSNSPPASVPDAASIPLQNPSQKQKAPNGAFCFWMVVELGTEPASAFRTKY